MTGAFLFGCLVGACSVFALTGLALWFVEWRAEWRRNHPARSQYTLPPLKTTRQRVEAGEYGDRLKQHWEGIKKGHSKEEFVKAMLEKKD